ncbi:MAG TPA: dihydrolipoyl dehydrogenase [Limnochordales bacterium]|nr:dihydrolipoyl dehydrogenase [Limnochordales bacterium]
MSNGQGARHDVVIIGGGPGGYVCAIRARQLGLSVGLIEKDALGGICLNWGCIPTKALLYSAGLLDEIRRAATFGIEVDNVRPNYAGAHKNSRRAADRLRKGVEYLMRSNGVTVYQGHARLTGPGQVSITGGPAITAQHIVLATGARPRSLPGLEPDGQRVLTSREALALTELPQSMVIIGAGAIGVEFASIFNSFGVDVTLVEALPQILPAEEPEISQELTKIFEKRGIKVLAGHSVAGVDKTASGVTVRVTGGDGEQVLQADAVLVAIGVIGNTEDLGLETVGVQVERSFIPVNERMETNVPGIYAIGDCTGPPLLAHVASEQGVVAAEAIAGQPVRALDYKKMPRATYCHPQVASVGLTEAQAREAGYDVKVGIFPLRANGLAVATGRTDGFIKIVAESQYDEILGMHAIGPEASELIAEIGLGQTIEATLHDVAATVHAHPTLSESVKEAALAAMGAAIHI